MTDLEKEKKAKEKQRLKEKDKRRTKQALKDEITPTIKRRVNITVDSRVWDKLDELDLTSKSAYIEDFIKKELHKKGLL